MSIRAILLPLIMTLLASGCISRPKPAIYADQPSSLTVRGDWNDIDSAVLAAGLGGEMGLLDKVGTDPRIFTLTTGNEESVTVWVWQRGEEIDLKARVGLFGDTRREAKLLKAIGDRLGVLYHREFAPLPGYP